MSDFPSTTVYSFSFVLFLYSFNYFLFIIYLPVFFLPSEQLCFVLCLFSDIMPQTTGEEICFSHLEKNEVSMVLDTHLKVISILIFFQQRMKKQRKLH